jgi:hypothetical protein
MNLKEYGNILIQNDNVTYVPNASKYICNMFLDKNSTF